MTVSLGVACLCQQPVTVLMTDAALLKSYSGDLWTLLWNIATLTRHMSLLLKRHHFDLLLHPGRRAPCGVLSQWSLTSLSVCAFVSLSVCAKPRDQSSQNFLFMSPVLCSFGVVIGCVLPVLWMTSHLPIMGHNLYSLFQHWGGVWCPWMPCFDLLYFRSAWNWSSAVGACGCGARFHFAAVNISQCDW